MEYKLQPTGFSYQNGNILRQVKALCEKGFHVLVIDFTLAPLAPAVTFNGVKIKSLLLIKSEDDKGNGVIKGYLTIQGEILPEIDSGAIPGYIKVQGETLPEITGDELATYFQNDFKSISNEVKKALKKIGKKIEETHKV